MEPRRRPGAGVPGGPAPDLAPPPDGAPDADWAAYLRRAGRRGDVAAVPDLFRGLAHPADEVRRAARRAVEAIGATRTFAAVVALARAGDAARLDPVLTGLAALEARPDLLTLLDQLVDLLTGNLLVRAHELLEKKHLSLGLERTQGLFESLQIPYRLEQVLGQGLFTAAYLARHTHSGEQVVVRVLREELAAQPLVRRKFQELCQRSVHLTHQNLVVARDMRFFPDRRVYVHVRAHVPGVTLKHVLDRGREFDPPQVVAILRQVIGALEPAHRAGHPHGAVKPSNIFLCPDDRVILGDLAPPVYGAGEAIAQRLAYDYRYAAPETLVGEEAPTPAADLYSVGCLAYELFCGRPPFVADQHIPVLLMQVSEPHVPPSRVRPGLPAAADSFVGLLLVKDRQLRPTNATAGQVELAELERALVQHQGTLFEWRQLPMLGA